MASKLELNNLSTWPIWFKVIVAAAITGAIFFIAKVVFLDDKKSELQGTESTYNKSKTNFATLQNEVADLDAIQNETNALELMLQDMLRYLPSNVEMPSLIDNVYESARENSIVFEQLSPEKDIEQTHYTIKPISLKANTGYNSMGSFIQKVTSLDRIMNIEGVTFKRGRGQNRDDNESDIDIQDLPLDMTAELRTYIFKDEDNNQNTRGQK